MEKAAPEVLAVQLQKPDGKWSTVGTLYNSSDVNWFAFEDSYWRDPDRSVLGQVFEEKGPSGVFRKTKVSLPRWFSHLLPEGYLRAQVAGTLGIPEVREFPMLRALGATDLPGAVRVVPDIADAPTEPGDWEESGALDVTPPELKFSLAGIQMKYSILETESGMTVPAKGAAGDFILKLPDLRPGFSRVPESEHAVMELGRQAGLDVVDSRLVHLSSIAGLPPELAPESTALLVSRFDRKQRLHRVHAEHFGQIFDISSGSANEKYSKANFEAIGQIALALVGPEAAREVLRRVAFNILIGNGDAHLKNWAVIYPDGKTPVLSPAYDIVPTVLYLANDDLGLNIGGEKRFSAIGPEHFARYLSLVGIDATEGLSLLEEVVSRVRESWPALAESLTKDQASRLASHLAETRLGAL